MYVCNTPDWIVYGIDAVLFLAAMLTIYVMQKADKDQQINRIDSKWVRNGRRMAFIAVAMMACVTILTDISLMAVFFLFLAATVLLVIDAIALNHRPPHRGMRSVERGPYVLAHRTVYRFRYDRFRHAYEFFRDWFK